jgi:hypothetical protein
MRMKVGISFRFRLLYIFLSSPLERYLNFWKTIFSVNFQDIIDC